MIRRLLIPLLLLPLAAHPAANGERHPATALHATPAERSAEGKAARGTVEPADTAIRVDRVQVTAIKQGMDLRAQPVAATIVGGLTLARDRIDAVKELSQRIPNFHAPDYGSRMTSSIYVRGMGARIDQPVVGLNVDNVPVLNKDCYDMELVDIERIEVLRGPQSTLYGRNTMGGQINVYTRSPLTDPGTRFRAEYGSGRSWRFGASTALALSDALGMAFSAFYTRSDGFFRNLHTGRTCDAERLGGGRWRTQWRNGRGLRLDNTLAFSALDQGGYPYAYIGEPLAEEGETILRPGEIRYNDPSGYRRTTLSDGLTVRYDAAGYSVASITSYQYSDDAMTLDQDFTPLSYFTLRQARRDHAVTQDVVFRSRDEGAYRWLVGAFGFYRHGSMEAPVHFKRTGIDRLIFDNANASSAETGIRYGKVSDELPLHSDFRLPSAGAALYHESHYTLGRWEFTAALRVDYEHTRLRYRSRADLDYTVSIDGGAPADGRVRIDERRSIERSYTELLPKAAVTYRFDASRDLYLSVSKGYKAGGFNTQMFSDILQEKIKWQMLSGLEYDAPERMSYRPEYSWNYELGGHFTCADGIVRGDFALFWIDCRDQQLTVFPPGATTGRMMTNAGRTRSRGAELSLVVMPRRHLEFSVAYGFTDARFRRYDSTEENAAGEAVAVSYRGKRIPYAPQHTLSAGAAWTLPTGVAWLGDVVLRAGMRGAGRIWWNERNDRSQPFYALVDASLAVEHPRYGIALWSRNLASAAYDVFYFKSIGNEFVQRGRPRTFGITLTLKID